MGLPTTNDLMIRKALKARLARRHAGHDAVIVEELKTARGSSRLDMAVINGRIEGLEIKSDVDTLDRLQRQAEHFGGAVDRMTLVVGRRHAERAMECAPQWWAIKMATVMSSGGVSFRNLRRGLASPERNSVDAATLLERQELVALLARHRLDAGYRTATYQVIVDRLVAGVRPSAIAEGVRDMLKLRAVFHQADASTAFGRNSVICGCGKPSL
jgi:hypothetical protein